MPNMKAPMISEGPSGAMAPPKFCRQRGDRHDRQRANRDHDQPAEQAARLPARQKAPPRRGVAEFGFQEGDAEAEAAEDQRGRPRLAVEQHQRDQDRGRDERERQGTAGRCRMRRPIGAPPLLPWSLKCLDATSGTETELLLQIVPLGARGLNGAAGIAGPFHHRAGIEPGVARGRAIRAARTSRSPPSGRCCNR